VAVGGLHVPKLIPRLAEHYVCYAIDLPGAGATRWREDNDFSFSGQAANVGRLIDALGFAGTHIVAHDTGATIARAGAERR
jgi:pimeloyl-ACP methyl ester carboxylesterase